MSAEEEASVSWPRRQPRLEVCKPGTQKPAVPGNLHGSELLVGGTLCNWTHVEAATVPLTHSVSFEPSEIEMDQELLSLVTCFTADSVVEDFLLENYRAFSPEKGKTRALTHVFTCRDKRACICGCSVILICCVCPLWEGSSLTLLLCFTPKLLPKKLGYEYQPVRGMTLYACFSTFWDSLGDFYFVFNPGKYRHSPVKK